MLQSLSSLFRSAGASGASSRRGRRRAGPRADAPLSLQQLEQRHALAFTAQSVTIRTNPSAESAIIVAIDDTIDANGEGRNVFMQYATDGNPYFLFATNPSFNNATRVSAATSAGSVTSIVVLSSSESATVANQFFNTTYAVGGNPPAPGNTTSGNFAHSFTFQSSTLIPNQRLIVDLSPAGSSISINSRWDASLGDSVGTVPGGDMDLTVYRQYGGYLTAGQIALYATNVNVSSDVTFRDAGNTTNPRSRFSADGYNQPGSGTQRVSLFTQPVRNVNLNANVGLSAAGTNGADVRIRVEGTTTNAGLLQVSPAATVSATGAANVTTVGADIRVLGTLTSPSQTYLFNPADLAGSPFSADPNTYTFTTRSQATGVQSGNLVATSAINMTLGNPAGGTVDVRTDAARLGFQSGLTGNGIPFRYGVNVEENNDLVISSVGASSGPISIMTGTPGTTGNDLTIQGNAVQTAGDLSLTSYGTLGLGGSLSSSAGSIRLQSDSLQLDSGVTAGGGRNVSLFTNPPVAGTGNAVVNGLSRAGGPVLRSVRLAAEKNYGFAGITTFNGVTLTSPADDGTRLLLKNQLDSKQNGIYVWNAGALTRAADNDEAAEFVPGFAVYAVEGTQEGSWVFQNPVQPIFSGNQNQTGLSFIPATAALTYANARLATTANLPTLAGLLPIDGIATNAGDRVLVKNQTNKAQNGIYVVDTVAWKRAGDADSIATLDAGGYVFVTEGTTQSGTGWVLANDAVSVGTTPLSFVAFTQQSPTTVAFWAPPSVLKDVDVATTATITLAGVGQSIDGVLLVGGERVLVKNQIDAAQNGVYVASAGVWSRATDADTGAELPRGTTVYVLKGTQGAGTSWSFDDAVRRMGTVTLNSTTLSGLSSTAGLTSGMLVTGEGIPANTTIASIIDGTSVRLSTVATQTRSPVPVTFTPLLDTVLGTTPIAFLPAAGDVNIAASRSISGSSRLQAAAALLQAGTAPGAGQSTSTINARTNVGSITATSPAGITLDNSTPVDLASVSTTVAGPIRVDAAGTITATSVTAKAVAGTPGAITLTSTFGDVVAKSVASDLGDVTFTSVNGSVELPVGSNVVTTGSIFATADSNAIRVKGRVAAQGTGSDISFSSANGSIDIASSADVSAQDQVRIFAGDPSKTVTVSTSKFSGTRLDWTAAGPLPNPLGSFKSLKATRTDDGPLAIVVGAAGTFTIEGLNTKNGSISVSAPDLLISGAIFTGDSATPGTDDDVSLTATAGKIIVDANVSASRDVKLSATDIVSYSANTVAAATAQLGGGATAGQVASLTVTAPGANYTAPPTVTVAPPQTPGGVRAVFTAILGAGAQAGQVTGFQQVVAGSGYTAPPTVTIGAPAVITAGNATTFTANGTARLNTKTKTLAGTLSGPNATLQVTEADDLDIGTISLSAGGTASITTGSATKIGNLTIDSLDTGVGGDVRIDAFGNVTGKSPAPDVVGSTATIQSTGGKIDLATSLTGAVTAVASQDVSLANSTALLLSNVTSTNGKIVLAAQGTVTQVAGARISATSGNGLLDVTATGNVTLANAGNNVNALAVSNGTAQVTYNDADDFSVGGTGIASGTATLSTGTPGGSITQTAAIVVQSLVVNNTAGAVVLTNAANNAATVSIQASTQTVKYTDADSFVVAAPGIVGGDVTLATVSAAATVSQQAAITAATVTLNGTGGMFLLDTQANQTGAFSSNAGSGVVKFRDSAGNLAIGQVTGVGGDVTVTASGPVTQTAPITTGSFTINSNGSPITLSTFANDVTTFSASNGSGDVSFFDAAGGLVLGGITAGSVVLTTIGPLTQSALITAQSLQITGGGGSPITLDTQANSIGLFRAVNVGTVAVKDTVGDLLVAGVDGTAVSITAAGTVTQSLPITATSLTVKGGGSPILLNTQNNLVGSFSATNGTGAVSFLDAAGGFDVTGIAAGPVTLTTVGPLTQSAAITATSLSVTGNGSPIQLGLANAIDSFAVTNGAGSVTVNDAGGDLALAGVTAGAVSVNTAGSLSQTAAITATSLAITANGRSARLDNRANQVSLFTGTNVGGDVTLVNAATFSAGPLTAGTAGSGNGNLSLTSLAGNIAVVGNLTALQDQVELDARNGTITFAPGVGIYGDILVYYYDVQQPAPVLPGTVPAIIATNGNLTIVNPAVDNTVLINGYSATGNITIVSTTGFQVSGKLRTTGVNKTVELTASSGTISFVGAGGIDNDPALGGSTTIKADNGTVTGVGGTSLSGGTTTITVSQPLTLPGPIAANLLSVSAAGNAIALAGGNQIGTFSTANGSGNVTLVDTTGNLVLSSVSGGNVKVTAAGAVTQSAAITAASLEVIGVGSPITLDTQANVLGQFAASNAGGNVFVRDTAGDLVLDGITGASVTITAAGAVSQTAPITAGGLAVNGVGSTIALDTQTNVLSAFASSNAGGNVFVRDTAGDLMLAGIVGVSVTVTAAGAVSQSAPITAGGLAVNGVGSPITLDSQPNAIGAFATSNGAGAISVKDTAGDLVLAGVVGGTVAVTAAGAVTQSAPITATSLTVTGVGSPITLNSQANVLDTFAATNGTGAVAVKDTVGTLALGAITSGTLSVAAAGAVTVNQTRVIASGPVTITTQNGGGLTVTGPQPGGLVQSSGQLNLAGVQGQIALVNGGLVAGSPITGNGQAIQVGGTVTTVAALNSAVSQVNSLPTIAGSPYEILVGATIPLSQTLAFSRPVSLRGTSTAVALTGSTAVPNGVVIAATASGSRITSLAFSGFGGTAIQLNSVTGAAVSGVVVNGVNGTTTGIGFAGTSTGTTLRGSQFNSCGNAISIVGATGLTVGGTAAGQPNTVRSAARAGVFASGVCTGSSVIKTAFVTTKQPYNVGAARGLTIVN